MRREECHYVIDSKDVIQSWVQRGSDQDSWNQSNDSCVVAGTPIWGFVDGGEARQLYQLLFEKVRSGCSLGPIPFRCDSDRERVFMELFLEPLNGGKIGVSSCFVKSESRDPVRLFDESAPRSEEIVTICCMCKKVKNPDASWVEVEEAAVAMKLFEMERLPQLSHGLCKDCGRAVLKEAGLSPDLMV